VPGYRPGSQPVLVQPVMTRLSLTFEAQIPVHAASSTASCLAQVRTLAGKGYRAVAGVDLDLTIIAEERMAREASAASGLTWLVT
jgi:hypothetical protein